MVFVFYSSSAPSRLDIEGDSGAVNGPMPGFDDVFGLGRGQRN